MRKFLVFALFVALLSACNNSVEEKNVDNDNNYVSVNGAGATFPMPFYRMIFKKYTNQTGNLVIYGGIGSGGGIRSIKDRIVDFGATDAFLTESKMKDLPAEIVHIPTCLGAVVIAYNLPGVNDIKLTPDLIADIFTGRIKKWNHPKIKENNNSANLPDTDIIVVHRADGSGTTHIFSDFMTKTSSVWASEMGTGKSLKWKTGIGSNGNPGVSRTIKATKGAIGYIGSEYAFEQDVQSALVMNKSGKYIKPSISSITAAAKGNIPDNTCVMLTNSADENSYPISGFTWLIIYKEQSYDYRSLEQAEQTVKLLNWIINKDAQQMASKVHYAPLPKQAVEKARNILKTITYNGKVILNKD